MPVLIASIFKSIPQLGSVAGLCGFLFLIFGIVGEELFEGALHYRCFVDPGADAQALLTPTPGRRLKGGGGGGGAGVGIPGDTGVFCALDDPATCPMPGGVCHYFGPNQGAVDYDSVINACMGIVQVITFDTWSPSMYSMMAAVSPYVTIYFLLVALLGGFFVVNLFLAVVFDEFMRSKAQAEEVVKMETRRACLAAGPLGGGMSLPAAEEPDPGPYVPSLHSIVESSRFGYATMALLAGNMVVMCMPYAGMSAEYSHMLENLTVFFTIGFLCELTIKLLGLGWRSFWSEGCVLHARARAHSAPPPGISSARTRALAPLPAPLAPPNLVFMPRARATHPSLPSGGMSSMRLSWGSPCLTWHSSSCTRTASTSSPSSTSNCTMTRI
jgi:hypothetical protein